MLDMRSKQIGTELPVLLLIMLCAGCVTTDPLAVDFAGVKTSSSQAPVEGCAVYVAPVVDARRSREDLGMLGPRVVEGQHVIPWVERAVQSLSNPTLDTANEHGGASGLKQVDVQIALNQLYVHPLQSSFGGNLLLNVQYRLNQGPPQSRQYRGSDTSVSWFGSAGSVSDLLSDVLEDLLRQMQADIVQLCRTGT